MKISYNTIQQLVGFELPAVNELVGRLNQQLGTVESIVDLGDKYKDATIVKIVECAKHPNADRLSVCMIDAGTDSLIQVVCGAPNVRAGMWAIWLPPESVVPSTYGDAEPFVLGARELRGVISNGMLAAGDELAINSDHDGIVELTEDDMPNGAVLSTGDSFADVFELNDTQIDIENKMFTHRPDLFGQLGVAREIFAILQPEPSKDVHENLRFSEPEWYWPMAEFDAADTLPLTTFNDAPEFVPRVLFAVMDNVTVRPSPFWLQTTLVRWGSKPINNIVDLTNYIMLLTAQPTHAYDYTKLAGQTIGARLARKGESITLLNGKKYELTTNDVVIADAEKPLGLGGIMGGHESEVTDATTSVVLEVATFDMYAARKSSMRHGLFTDALTRFNKGQSPLQNDRVMKQLLTLMTHAGARQASEVFDLASGITSDDKSTISGPMQVQSSFVNDRLGLSLTPAHIGNLLRFVNFASYKPEGADSDVLEITAPFWRTDIVDPEDIVEEVGRLYGFDKLPRELPRRSAKVASQNTLLSTKQYVRNVLTSAGANEVLTYSFVHERLLTRSGQNPAHAYNLSNAISPDLQYYRLSLTPSLLDKVHMNLKAGHETFALYELGRAHCKPADDAETTRPIASERVGFTIASNDKVAPAGSAYYVAQRYLRRLIHNQNLTLTPANSELGKDDQSLQLLAPFDTDRSAVVIVNGNIVGVVGEYADETRRAFKLPIYSAGFEIDIAGIEMNANVYKPLSKFPSISQDVSIRATGVMFKDIAKTVTDMVTQHDKSIEITVKPTIIYKPDNADEITTTFRLTATSHAKTLRDSDLKPLIDVLAKAVADAFDGRVV